MIVKLKPYRDLSGDHEDIRRGGWEPDLFLCKVKGTNNPVAYEWQPEGCSKAFFQSVTEVNAAMKSLTSEAVIQARASGTRIYIVHERPPTSPDELFTGQISS
jgi:hypothetical protein